ncbi:hypothetical protein EON66_01995 [archaeon]|nr:MAG: hypothetical protein EON66_01995 [archaeon]
MLDCGVQFASKQPSAPAGRRLFDNPEAETLVNHFHDRFGAHTRRVAYSYLLNDQQLMLHMFNKNCGPTQTRIVAATLPVFLST